MKKTMLFAALLIAMSATINAQSNMQNKNADQAVTTVLEQMTDAYNKSDVPFFEKYFADTYIFTDPGGIVHNKKDMIDYMKGGNFKLESVIPSDRKITVYENTAVVTEHTTEKGHVGTNDIAGEYRWMYIFFKQGGEWKIIAMEGTRIMQSK